MCHQYAYASTLVDECYPILEDMEPMAHRWLWPDVSCPDAPALPPFNNHVPKTDKDTEYDSDDEENPIIEEPYVKHYPQDSYHHWRNWVLGHHKVVIDEAKRFFIETEATEFSGATCIIILKPNTQMFASCALFLSKNQL